MDSTDKVNHLREWKKKAVLVLNQLSQKNQSLIIDYHSLSTKYKQVKIVLGAFLVLFLGCLAGMGTQCNRINNLHLQIDNMKADTLIMEDSSKIIALLSQLNQLQSDNNELKKKLTDCGDHPPLNKRLLVFIEDTNPLVKKYDNWKADLFAKIELVLKDRFKDHKILLTSSSSADLVIKIKSADMSGKSYVESKITWKGNSDNFDLKPIDEAFKDILTFLKK